MKIVFASTQSQDEEISGLVEYIYASVFPLYFTDQEIREFKQLEILRPDGSCVKDFSTLKSAFQVMTSLQTLISILESPVLYEHFESLFEKNIENLKEYDLFFPFHYNQFVEAKRIKNNLFSMYIKPANELLV